jgi:hypothetical protein
MDVGKGWLRSTIFLGANGVLVALVYLLLVVPAVDLLQDQRWRIEQGTLALEQARSVIARNEAISSVSPADVEAAAQRFIQGNRESLLDVDLLRRLRQLAGEQGVSFRSITPLPPREWLARRLVGARIEFAAPAGQAAAFLMSIEHGPSLLFIHQAALSPDREGGTDTLALTLEVYGVAQWSES